MRRSTDRTLTTHVGALPAPPDVWGVAGVDVARLREEVTRIVAAQKAAGVDFINEGEVTKGGTWVYFVNSRLRGYEPATEQGRGLALLLSSADWREFGEFYQDRMAAGTLFEETRKAPAQAGTTSARVDWECVAPLEYIGQDALKTEIDLLVASLGSTPVSDAFLTSTAPMSIEVGRYNRHYATEEQYVHALADALRVEYEAIAASGLQLQIDDAWMAALWDRIGIPMGLAAYRKHCALRIEALNHALRNIPETQIRYHLCWGSWHGPHSHDIPMPDIVDLMLSIKAQTYLFEAANVRHEHEAELWGVLKLPEGKILAPGCVSHATTLIEHPELVSQRIQRFARLVGRENVIASTDCGLGLRCHPQVAWAKLRALTGGAARASATLWGRAAA
jgi:5-methyltetrahydropteroyltriglutamate--homocysteine methyltransferase